MNAATEIQNIDNVVILKRVFNAPRERVWEAWTKPELIAQWWAPNGLHAPLEKITCDLREGGVFAVTMVADEDGTENAFDGVFEIVDPPARMVYVNTRPGSDTTFATTFEEVDDGKTEVTLVLTSSASPEMRAGATAGWQDMYEKLAKVLEQ